jgi:hypothetical protein
MGEARETERIAPLALDQPPEVVDALSREPDVPTT